jgi:phosphoenolpyruvate carboxykinase (GTP)
MKLPCNTDFDAWLAGRENVREFIDRNIDLCKPDALHICSGTEQEYDEVHTALVNSPMLCGLAHLCYFRPQMCESLVKAGIFVPVPKRPRSFWAHTDPKDVARVEARTFICSRTKDEAGPTNNWMDPAEMKACPRVCQFGEELGIAS